MASHGSTRARVLHWFVRGGVAKAADGRSFPIDVDPVVVGRDDGANISIEDPEVGFADHFGPLVGTSPKMRRVFGILEKVAATPLSVIILGETGTGKEVLA